MIGEMLFSEKCCFFLCVCGLLGYVLCCGIFVRRGTIVFKGLDKYLQFPSRWHKENLIKSFDPLFLFDEIQFLISYKDENEMFFFLSSLLILWLF